MPLPPPPPPALLGAEARSIQRVSASLGPRGAAFARDTGRPALSLEVERVAVGSRGWPVWAEAAATVANTNASASVVVMAAEMVTCVSKGSALSPPRLA